MGACASITAVAVVGSMTVSAITLVTAKHRRSRIAAARAEENNDDSAGAHENRENELHSNTSRHKSQYSNHEIHSGTGGSDKVSSTIVLACANF